MFKLFGIFNYVWNKDKFQTCKYLKKSIFQLLIKSIPVKQTSEELGFF